jgi:hypothetical protein
MTASTEVIRFDKLPFRRQLTNDAHFLATLTMALTMHLNWWESLICFVIARAIFLIFPTGKDEEPIDVRSIASL